MATNPVIRQIPRDKLFEIFKNAELVKLFESVLYGVGTTLPAGIEEATGLANAAEATAESAQANLNAHIGDATDAHDASAISNLPAGSIAAVTVQAAINELDGDVQAVAAGLASYARPFLLMGA